MNKIKGERLKTPIARAAFTQVFEAKSYQEGNPPKFSITLLFDKKARETAPYKALQKEVSRLYKEMWKGKKPKGFESPFKKGEALQDGEGKWYEGCDEETIAIKATTGEDYPPGIINRNGDVLTSEKDFYSGCFCIASITPTALELPTNKCIAFYLQNIVKVKDGAHLGGKVSAKKEFENIDWDDYGDLDDLDGSFDDDEDSFDSDDDNEGDDGEVDLDDIPF